MILRLPKIPPPCSLFPPLPQYAFSINQPINLSAAVCHQCWPQRYAVQSPPAKNRHANLLGTPTGVAFLYPQLVLFLLLTTECSAVQFLACQLSLSATT